ncbi:MAG: bifunctional folylpolyglutamate synthase/dihydrofolate synthase [Treponema sp.]|nr:bifunctional folylpolyglutamate synthase/dihydrofolate synthase [Treponema sp.]
MSTSIYPSLDALQSWLDTYLNFEKTPQKNIFWLDTMRFLCERLSHPELSCPSFHVAGSKGKGSVSVFISSILEAAGCRTGLYTSPHILDFAERIGSAHAPFPERVYAEAASILKNAVSAVSDDELSGGRRLTWFELVTVYAFLCFKLAGTEYSVYEVGLGGRLDSTNVISPVACCITPIELEHTEFLGDTLEKIAREKGGIIKPGVPVFIADQKPQVRAVFEEIARERNAPVHFIDKNAVSVETEYVYAATADADADVNATADFCMQVTLKSGIFSRPLHANLRLTGNFQAWNAALAAYAVKTVIPDIDEKAIERGLSEACLPGRFEVLHGSALKALPLERVPVTVLDGAHTVNSVGFTLMTFLQLLNLRKKQGDKDAPVHLLFACAADKDMSDIALLFRKEACGIPFSRITLTRPGDVKQSNLGALQEAFSAAGLSFQCDDSYENAITAAYSEAAKERAPLLITGSFYLLAEVKKLLLQSR